MCGILGGWWKKEPDNFDSLIRDGLVLLNHRGPDDRGFHKVKDANGSMFMGQTRLSIIDLSNGGHQPIFTPDGRYVMVFNGEIYNYKEIREELKSLGHVFHTESDTEVLLASWVQWQMACLHRIVGMFAFSVLDTKQQTITLVRDAFGIKPLFYHKSENSFSFGSEIQAVMHLSDKKVVVNDQRVFDYLIYAVQDVGRDTFIADIHHVPPAHIVTLDLNNPSELKHEQWWNPPIKERKEISFQEAVSQVKGLFLESIKLHLRSDVPIGIALSGGIDSSAIACAVRYLEPDIDIHTFSFIPENSDLSEEYWMDLVNKHIDAIPHKTIVKPNELSSDIADLINTQGEPFCTTSMYAQYRVFKLASEVGVKVVLEGQGADELLAGYQGYQGQRMRSLLESGDVKGMIRFAKNWKQWEGRIHLSPWRALLGQLLSDDLFSFVRKFGGERRGHKWINKDHLKSNSVQLRPVRMKRAKTGKKRRVTEVLLDALMNNGLPSLLRYGDRNAMRFSIENRVPFLTIPLAELLLSLPEHFLISEQGETKSVFRAALRGIVPNEILDRRDKVGFESPMGKWVSELKDKIKRTKPLEGALKLINFDKIEEFNNSTQGREAIRSQDWRLVNLLFWAENFIVTQGYRMNK